MIYSVFKNLRTWLVICFESYLQEGKRQEAIELSGTMTALHDFLRGSAAMPMPAILASTKGRLVKPFKNLLAKNNIVIKPNPSC